MNMLKEKQRGQVNYLVHKNFCPEVKIPFAGEKSEFKTIELDIWKKCQALMQYVSSPKREQLSDDEWIINLDFDTVNSFFEPERYESRLKIAIPPSPAAAIEKVGKDRIHKFCLMVSKETEVDVNKEISHQHHQLTQMMVKKLGSFTIDLPDVYLGLARSVLVSLRFASMENTVVTAKHETNGDVYRTTFSNEE
ncbi:13157_t:CDS:2 [Ambispora leptoticha]|uniref:13157_t:CDS:1 n=1 Tax=Ambispora leptoticha TaxID=144679 RepID=A0A9N9CM46_9GLOM|nr:13157_t:CDS:2 [Ambispora leptoticha]